MSTTTQQTPVASTPVVNKWIEPGATRPSCSNCYGKTQWNDDECSLLCEKLSPLPKPRALAPAEGRCYTFHGGYLPCPECGAKPTTSYDPTKMPKVAPIPYGWGASLGDAPSYQREALIKYLEEKKHQPTQ